MRGGGAGAYPCVACLTMFDLLIGHPFREGAGAPNKSATVLGCFRILRWLSSASTTVGGVPHVYVMLLLLLLGVGGSRDEEDDDKQNRPHATPLTP